MSLEITIQPKIQAFRKQGVGWLLFGLQSAYTFILLPIYNAYPDFITADSGEITADNGIITADQVTYDIITLESVKIDAYKKEISRTTLPSNMLKWENSQWLVDTSKQMDPYFDESIYYLEITTSEQIIQSEPFLVSKIVYFIRADMTEITADSGIILTNTSNINL